MSDVAPGSALGDVGDEVRRGDEGIRSVGPGKSRLQLLLKVDRPNADKGSPVSFSTSTSTCSMPTRMAVSLMAGRRNA